MTTLDNNPTIDESTVPFFPSALRIGLYGGLAVVIFGLISNITGLTVPTSIMNSLILGLIGIIIYVGIGVFSVKKHRDEELGGYISFGRAFIVSLIAMVVAGIIGALFNAIYYSVIDPGFVDTAVEGMEEMMSNMGVEGELADAQIEQMKKQFSPSYQLTIGVLVGSLFGAVLSLIIAAIMKKNKPVV